jgi:endonuclease/exonuclease/phosphatase family metal-dependent hydrolase
MRVVTWNVWGRYGEWERREKRLHEELVRVQPDVVGLVESWASDDTDQPAAIASTLGYANSAFAAGSHKDSGLGLVSRWPITSHELRPLGEKKGGVLCAQIEGPRGRIQLFVVALDWPLSASAVRQQQVRELLQIVADTTTFEYITVLCGDFNAHPDSDEMRMLLGKSAADRVFYDAWEIAGDGTAGITWSNENPLARIGKYPDRRFDYVLSEWPRLGAAGHPVHCERLGVLPEDAEQISDHYGVLADLRY